jgi:uncharacterized protein (UPF0276 family)
MRFRAPTVTAPRGLGVGMDMPWGDGFVTSPGRGDHADDARVNYLRRSDGRFAAMFASWQPRSRQRLDARDYFPAWDDLFARAPRTAVRTLHQTAFNLGALEPYERGPLVDLTNALVERYGLAWINEDLGLWSIRGHALPYPLPPYLTAKGLRAAVRNTAEVQSRLAAPLVVEFPGFSDGSAVIVGAMHAYDFFRALAEETASPVTLDVGHLLTYQWVRGRRGEALYDELERLPLAHCIEVHMSGCSVVGGRFYDAHHGVLLDAQLALLARLLPLCPALRVVTYEDPRVTPDGALSLECRDGFDALASLVDRWSAA